MYKYVHYSISVQPMSPIESYCIRIQVLLYQSILSFVQPLLNEVGIKPSINTTFINTITVQIIIAKMN